MTVPVGLLYALVPIVGAGLISFVAWLIVQIGHHAELLAKAGTEIGSHDKRIGRLEAYQDGVSAGRVIGKAEAQREAAS
jgi:hypothetical protein